MAKYEVTVTMQDGVGEEMDTRKEVHTYDTDDRAKAVASALKDCDFSEHGERLQINVVDKGE